MPSGCLWEEQLPRTEHHTVPEMQGSGLILPRHPSGRFELH